MRQVFNLAATAVALSSCVGSVAALAQNTPSAKNSNIPDRPSSLAFSRIPGALGQSRAAVPLSRVVRAELPAPWQVSVANQNCLNACPIEDVNCHAQCVGVPHPNHDTMVAVTDCVARCPQGSGSAEDSLKYGACQSGCISSFIPLNGTPPVPADGGPVNNSPPKPAPPANGLVSTNANTAQNGNNNDGDAGSPPTPAVVATKARETGDSNSMTAVIPNQDPAKADSRGAGQPMPQPSSTSSPSSPNAFGTNSASDPDATAQPGDSSTNNGNNNNNDNNSNGSSTFNELTETSTTLSPVENTSGADKRAIPHGLMPAVLSVIVVVVAAGVGGAAGVVGLMDLAGAGPAGL